MKGGGCVWMWMCVCVSLCIYVGKEKESDLTSFPSLKFGLCLEGPVKVRKVVN